MNVRAEYIVSSSPHAHSGASVPRIMIDVLIALAPAAAAAIWFFGAHAAWLMAVCVGSCVAAEGLCRLAMRRECALGDFSACVTGLLLALTLPPQLPLWMAAVGSVFAIVIAKQVFGGLGYNIFNPALAGRAFLLISFTGAMTTWSASGWQGVDAVTTATPLSLFNQGGVSAPDGATLFNLFIGNVNGSLGEVSAAALLLGGLYLLWRRVITWQIPVSFIATVAVYAGIVKLCDAQAATPLAHVLSGGLFLGAIFMATDMVTSPITRKGQLIFGVGCGLITMVIRTSKTGAYPEGVCFSILIMNALVPLIHRISKPRAFGTGRRAKEVCK